eukprot:TRINITY_DN12987_c0_g1_i3.p1 TRINITY_DN12987_c0_g1~~TRINITY_DN12987_c0_g1_i3.p1  ORF type:complete len:198 (-),score=38.77 TRINITY_DN12987_c0_g1_i3:138-731(-)
MKLPLQMTLWEKIITEKKIPKMFSKQWYQRRVRDDWEEKEFSGPLHRCGFCGELIKRNKGFKCTECKYICHAECKDTIPSDCTHDPKNPILHCHLGTKGKRTWGRKKSTKLNRVKSSGDIKGSILNHRLDLFSQTDEVSAPVFRERPLSVSLPTNQISVPIQSHTNEASLTNDLVGEDYNRKKNSKNVFHKKKLEKK